MRAGDISAKVNLDTLKDLPHVYALGAMAELKGEIQIFEGQVVNTSVQTGHLSIDSTFNGMATLLVWAEVPRWKEHTIPPQIKSRQQLEQFIKETAKAQGMDTATPFPFLLEGTVDSLDWHIINWPEGDMEHSHEKHITSGLHGVLHQIPVEILGFYSRHHRGIFTHHSSYSHLHFTTPEAPFAGHVDDLQLGSSMRLKLPFVE